MQFWTVVVPVKRLDAAKTRLDRADRAEVALALASDTVAAVAACPVVAEVLVVTDDARAAAAVAGLARVVPDEPARGLNAALAHGAAVAIAERPDTPVAALAADLPALRPEELAAALEAAAQAPAALVADAAGIGTVLLTAAPGRPLDPHFGAGSRVAHVRAGAEDLTDRLEGRVPGLRRDVDTLADLADAVALGLGPATRMLAARPGDVQATMRRWDPVAAAGNAVTDDGRVVDLPAGTRLVGLRGLRAGQRVRIAHDGQDVSIGLVTDLVDRPPE